MPDLSRVILPFPHIPYLVKRAQSQLKALQWSSKALKGAEKDVSYFGHIARLKPLEERGKSHDAPQEKEKSKQEEKS